MGQPVKVSDALVELARTEAESTHRSMAAQIEHWAALGRAAERLLDHDDVAALKRLGGAAVASTGAGARERVERALAKLDDPEPSEALLARIRSAALPTYGVDAKGRLVRREADGTRRPGRLVDGVFVPDPPRHGRARAKQKKR